MNRRFQLVVVTSSTCLVVMFLLGAMLGRSASPEDAYRHLAVYTEVLSRIKSDYVEEPDLKNVTMGALNGLLESLDPFASYLNADQYKQYLKHKDDPRAHVGLILSRRFGYVGVVSTVPGSPADKAGFATGDVIEAIREIGTRDMPLAYAELLLHGEPGTKVDLTVMRVRRGAEPQKMTLTREKISYPAVAARLLTADIGYLRVQTLEKNKSKAVEDSVRKLQSQGARRLILDVRDNAIGTPEEGLALADAFLEKGLMAYLQGQNVPRQNFEAKQPAIDLPLAVLTSRGTAGGAELAASALLDQKRAEVVGDRTYGDAAVRRAVTLDDGAAVILSVAKYYSSEGKAIQDVAVTPSVPVIEPEPSAEPEELEGTERPAAPEAERRPEDDPVVKRAIEVLTKGVSKVASGNQAPEEASRPLTPLNIPRPPQ